MARGVGRSAPLQSVFSTMCYADAAMLSAATEERLQLLEGTAGFPNIQLAEIVRALVWRYMREEGNGFDQAQQDKAVVRAFRSICEALASQAGPLGAVHVQGLIQDKESNQRPVGALSAALLFADMQGYTRATAEADRRGTMAELIETMGRLRQRMYDSLEQAGGGRIDCGGDGVFAWVFDPLQALEAAVGIQDSLRQDPIIFPGTKQRVRMRMALHWGDVCVGTASSEKMIIGTAVNLTSRMLQVADLYDNDDPAVAGCVVVSDRLINEIKGRELTDGSLPEGTVGRWRRRWCQVNREQFAGLVGQTEPIATYIVYPDPFEAGHKTTFVDGLACYLQDNWELAEQRFNALLAEGSQLDPKLVNPCRELLHYMYRVQARTMEAANLMARHGVTKHFPELGTMAEERGWRRRGEPSLLLRRFLGSLALERSNTWHPPVSGCHGFRFTPKEYRGHKEKSELRNDSPDNIFGFRHPLDVAMES